jgi:cytochrome P450
MSTKTDGSFHWDPYDVEIYNNPYPAYRRLREEAPLYHNEEYGFYAVSRFDDVEKCLSDRDTYISRHGSVLDYLLRGEMAFPAPIFIFQDPPVHTIYRGLVSRVFTPAKMNALESEIRAYCARSLDPLVGTGKFDFVRDLGAEMPMRVIGMMLGIPEQDLKEVQKRADDRLRTEPGKPMKPRDDNFDTGFEEYIDWRIKHPSDDLMTMLLNAEFVDEHGVKRTLTRTEVSVFCNLFAGAGNETTNRLIGWTGKVLGEHPDQRRQIVENRTLIPQAIEEVLRYEPPGGAVSRYVAKDVELYGTKVPEGSALACIVGAANRDERRFVNGDRFDIHRERRSHLTFGYGFHVCLGNALARVEGRVALDEILNRFPDWELDMENSKLIPSTGTRGWETLPVSTH